LEQPKKPVGGAFGIFMAEKRPEFLKTLAGKPVSEVSKMGGEAWSKLSDKQKEPYQKQYEDKKAQFDKDMAAFLEAGGEKTKGAAGLRTERRKAKEGKKEKDANAPKKPAGGGYGVYLAENRAAIVKSLPAGHKITDVTKAASAKWNAFSDAEKKTFQDKYLQKVEEYKVALEEYKKNLPEDANDDEEDGDEEDEHEESESPPKKSRKAGAKTDEDEVLAGASPQKKRKVANLDSLMDVAKKEGLHTKLKAMLDNPKLASKGSQVLLDALREAGGKVPDAKRSLLAK